MLLNYKTSPRLLAACLAVLLTQSVTAHAEDTPSGLLQINVMPASMAMTAAQAALDHCAADGYAVSIAVVDQSGILRAMVRGDNAPPHTIDSSRKKAYTAAAAKAPTSAIVDMIAAVPKFAGMANMNDEFIILGGGLPIFIGEAAVGGIGVAGAPGDELDEACGAAGLEAIGAVLPRAQN